MNSWKWNQNDSNGSNLHSTDSHTSWPLVIARLLSEREHLENGLAHSVTYLHTLCKRQGRNERRLQSESTMSRRKKKNTQQNNYKLKFEIRNCEQDEQAYLTNLQVCEANLYMAQLLFHPLMSPHPRYGTYASTHLSYCSLDHQCHPTYRSVGSSSESTRHRVHSHSDHCIISPISTNGTQAFSEEKARSDSYFSGFNSLTTAGRDPSRSFPLAPWVEDCNSGFLLPPNTAESSFPTPSPCSEALTCDFVGSNEDHDIASLSNNLKELDLTPTITIEKLEQGDGQIIPDLRVYVTRRRSSV